jgi:hypothetical protein
MTKSYCVQIVDAHGNAVCPALRGFDHFRPER